MKFYEKLYELRKSAGMTQNDLAEKLNVSRQAVSRWEQGSATPDVENLIAISDLFGVTLDELLRGEAPPTAAQQEKPVPRYWDFVHPKWWVPLVVAVAAFACYLLSFFGYALIPASFLSTGSQAMNKSRLLTLLVWIFGPMGMMVLFRVLPWVSGIFLVIAFVKWQKAKK